MTMVCPSAEPAPATRKTKKLHNSNSRCLCMAILPRENREHVYSFRNESASVPRDTDTGRKSCEPRLSDGAVEELGEPLDAVHHTGTGTAEAAVGVDRMDAAGPHGSQTLPDGAVLRIRRERHLRLGARLVEAARHDDDDIRIGRFDLLPGQPPGGVAGARDDVVAAGRRDHLGNPVAAGKGWIEPFESQNAWPRPARRPRADRRQAVLQVPEESAGLRLPSDRRAHLLD